MDFFDRHLHGGVAIMKNGRTLKISGFEREEINDVSDCARDGAHEVDELVKHMHCPAVIAE